MLRTFYDIETTGFSCITDDVIQLAYVVMKDRTFVKAGCLHFYYPDMKDSDEGALKAHHMSKEYLSQYADDYAKNKLLAYVALAGANVVGFNNHRFDDNFITYWLVKHGAPQLTFATSEDVMLKAAPLTAGNRISLVKLCARFGITPEIINDKCEKMFGETGGAHSAYYDTVATMLCYFEEIHQSLLKPVNPAQMTVVTDLDPDKMLDVFESYADDVPRLVAYDPECIWCETPDGFIPSCSDKTLYKSAILQELPEGAKKTSYVMPKVAEGHYHYDDGILEADLVVSDKANKAVFNLKI